MSGRTHRAAAIDADATQPPWAWRVFVRIVVSFLRVLFRWRVRVRIEGEVEPGHRPAVLVANHTGNAEPFLVAYTVWQATGHWIQPLVKSEIFDMPVVGALAPHAGAIPVHRDSAGGRTNAYRDAVARLENGGTIYIAPEGTITHDGRLLPLRHGAARLAMQAGVPIVVVTTFGGQRAFSPVVKRPEVGVLFDVVIEQLALDPDESAADLTGRIAATMIDRGAELRDSYPQADEDAPWWPPYSEPAEPSRTARENLEKYRDTMADSVARARERMAELRADRDVDERLRDARERAAVATQHARDRAHDLAEQVRTRSDELVAAARAGELGDQLRLRAEELSTRAEDLARQAREFADQLRAGEEDHHGHRPNGDGPPPTAPGSDSLPPPPVAPPPAAPPPVAPPPDDPTPRASVSDGPVPGAAGRSSDEPRTDTGTDATDDRLDDPRVPSPGPPLEP